jgi:hypothetical protein
VARRLTGGRGRNNLTRKPMIRTTTLLFSAALLAGGLFTSLSAQQARPGTPGENRGGPRFTEEQREAWRNLSPEERRERARQWQEQRAPGEAPRPAPAADPGPAPEKYIDQLEFRSILSLGGVTQFSLHNPWEGRSFVVTGEQSRNGVEVVEFNEAENSLTIRHEGETRTLALRAARVADLPQDQDMGRGQRREEWEARREEFRVLHEKWRTAVAQSPELQEIDAQFRELGQEFRQTAQALREAGRDSPEGERLREQMRETRQEFQLLSEYTVLKLQDHPDFSDRDRENMQQVVRMMSGRGEGRRGGWGERAGDQSAR